MLWMKAWLETRWRLTKVLAVAVLVFLMAESGPGVDSAEHANNLITLIFFLSIFAAVNLAGAGVTTQSSFRANRGLHGSMYLTLSLPVSRLRLLATRAGLGLLETAALSITMLLSAWVLFPLVRGTATSADLLRLILSTLFCITCCYSASVLMATVLDEIWQIYASFLLIGFLWALSHLALPPSANVFGYLSTTAPFSGFSLHWPAIGISLLLSAFLLLVAVKAVERREY
jgi:hypothetical protein